MDTYRALAPVTIPTGSLLQLSEAQAAARAYGIAREGAAWRVRLPVQFKTGEEFGYAGDLPKALAAQVSGAAARPAKPRPAKPLEPEDP
jgi:hypothetical protein